MCIKTAAPTLTANEARIPADLKPFIERLGEDALLGDALMLGFSYFELPPQLERLTIQLGYGATLREAVMFEGIMSGVRSQSYARVARTAMQALGLPKSRPTTAEAWVCR